MDILKFVEQFIPLIGQQAADALAAKIRELVSDESPAWQKTILALVANAIDKYGVTGVQIALDQVKALLDDKVPEIDWANLLVASDLVASLQNAEAQRRSEARDFLVKISDVLGLILTTVIKALLRKR